MQKQIVKYLMSKGLPLETSYKNGTEITNVGKNIFSNFFKNNKKTNLDLELYKVSCEKELRLRGFDTEICNMGKEIFQATLDFSYKVIQSVEKFEDTLSQVILDK